MAPRYRPPQRRPWEEEEGRDPFYDDPRVRRLYDEAEKILADVSSPEKLKKNPYHGKPLDLSSNPYAGENRMVFRMLKSSGFKLPWMYMKEEILAEIEALREAVRDHVERLEARAAAASRGAGGMGSGESAGATVGWAGWRFTWRPGRNAAGGTASKITGRSASEVAGGPDSNSAARSAPNAVVGPASDAAARPASNARGRNAADAAETPAHAALREEHQCFLEDIEERVKSLRSKILRYNLEVPILQQQVMNIRLEHLIEPYRERIDAIVRPAAGGEGGAGADSMAGGNSTGVQNSTGTPNVMRVQDSTDAEDSTAGRNDTP